MGVEQLEELCDVLDEANAKLEAAGKPGIRYGFTFTEHVESIYFGSRRPEYTDLVNRLQERVLRNNGVDPGNATTADLKRLIVSTGWTGRGKYERIDGELYFPTSIESIGLHARGLAGGGMADNRVRTHQGDDFPVAFWGVSNEKDLKVPAVQRNFRRLAQDRNSVFAFGNHAEGTANQWLDRLPIADAAKHICWRMKVDIDVGDRWRTRTIINADESGMEFNELVRSKPSRDEGLPVISFENLRLAAEAEQTRLDDAAWPGHYI